MTIEVSDKQLAALVRGDRIAVGPSKRVITLDDGPFVVNRGGAGSGHHGHEGRPGEVGGSLPSGNRNAVDALFKKEQANLVEYAQNNWGEVKHLPKLAWMTPDGNMYDIVGTGYRHDENAALALVGAGVWEQEAADAVFEAGRIYTGNEAQNELMEFDFVRIMTTPKEFNFKFISPDRLTRNQKEALAVEVLLANQRGLRVLGEPMDIEFPPSYELEDLDFLGISWSGINRSYPAPHCGRPGEVGGSAPRDECAVSRKSAHNIFQHIPKTKRWDAVRKGLDAIDTVHGIDVWEALPLKETRSERKGASYHVLERRPYRFMVNMHDEYGENTEISIVHEVGHHIDHWLLGEKEPYAPVWFSEAMAAQYGISHHQLSVCGIKDMVERLSNYSVQDFTEFPTSVNYTLESARKPSDEISQKGIYLWDAITDSQAYRALQKYGSGHKQIHPIPEDYFVGARDNPSWVAANERITQPVITNIPYDAMRTLTRPRETFARAYAQYIATRSGNKEMIRVTDETISFARAGGAPTAWEWIDFEPIANAFDSLFRSKGWMNE